MDPDQTAPVLLLQEQSDLCPNCQKTTGADPGFLERGSNLQRGVGGSIC